MEKRNNITYLRGLLAEQKEIMHIQHLKKHLALNKYQQYYDPYETRQELGLFLSTSSTLRTAPDPTWREGTD